MSGNPQQSQKTGEDTARTAPQSTGVPGGDNRIREREREHNDESKTAQYGGIEREGCNTGSGRLQRTADRAISFQERSGKPGGGKGILI